MKNPFAAFSRHREEKPVSIDWSHQYIVHHILYQKPQATTTCGSYRTVSPEDFQDCIDKVREDLSKLDISVESRHIFDALIQSREANILCDLAETRLYHLRDAIAMRSDIEMEYQVHMARIDRMRRIQEALLAEKDALQTRY